jgi:hypothetical protein
MNPSSTPYGYCDIETAIDIPRSMSRRYSTLSAPKKSARFLPLDRECECGSGSWEWDGFFFIPDASRERFVGGVNHDPAPPNLSHESARPSKLEHEHKLGSIIADYSIV